MYDPHRGESRTTASSERPVNFYNATEILGRYTIKTADKRVERYIVIRAGLPKFNH